MAIFFFVIGLELKREISVGELANIKLAMLPLIAAVGGMLVPVLIYIRASLLASILAGVSGFIWLRLTAEKNREVQPK